MLNENIRAIRKSRGLSQEELAIKLNVVRQTVSKWERGLSVPDSDMLVSLSVSIFWVRPSSLPNTLGDFLRMCSDTPSLRRGLRASVFYIEASGEIRSEYSWPSPAFFAI